eukprot:scaffold3006_cov172-Amphora_coffeaeformis.AAC.2
MEDTTGLGYRSQYPTPNGNQSLYSPSAPFVQGQTQVASITITKQPKDNNNDNEALQRHNGDDAYPTPQQQQKEEEEEESDELARRRIQERVEEGRLRAQAILRRFQEQQQTLLQMPSQIIDSSSNNTTQIGGQQQISSSSISSSSVYVEQRRKAAIREKRRLQEAWSKNFAYLAAKQDSETTQMEQKIAAAQQRQVEADQHYQRILEERKQRHEQQKEMKSQAGIGTHKRNRVEVTKAKLSQLPTVAVYISGIPRDGSIQASSLGDVFRAYGSVTKVHYYRDKTTGELKGDGLVVFEVHDAQEGGTLLHTVCAQMNGAELAEGIELHVELSASSAQGMAQVVPSGSQAATKNDTEESQDEDLDDFFDSL